MRDRREQLAFGTQEGLVDSIVAFVIQIAVSGIGRFALSLVTAIVEGQVELVVHVAVGVFVRIAVVVDVVVCVDWRDVGVRIVVVVVEYVQSGDLMVVVVGVGVCRFFDVQIV